jgi:hypothetical protein
LSPVIRDIKGSASLKVVVEYDLIPFVVPNSKLCVQKESVFLVCPFVGGSIEGPL